MNELLEGLQLELSNFTAVKFYSTECVPCKRLDTVMVKMEKEFPEINYISIDIDKHLKIAQTYRIMSVPTIIFFFAEKEISRVQGLVNTESLRKTFKTFLGKK